MSRQGIIVALAAEARRLGRAQQRPDGLHTLADGSLLAVTGMGLEAAARGAQALLAQGATSLLSFGLAGGLDPLLAPGFVLLPLEIVTEAGESLPTARLWRDQLLRKLASSAVIGSGRLLSVSQPLLSRADKARAFGRSGASAVDMESFAVADAAARAGLPCVALRVIIDTAAEELPRSIARATDACGEVRALRLLGALLRRPADLPALIRLSAHYRRALRALEGAAGALAVAEQSAPSSGARPA